ncbi:hypothetical protein Acsp06_36870 [Actinomycetospora sp. NBRC 106375]|uniref:hypothetical protein n=1 Tax=Actinomycetospora sp. NBRC 106375 TaxID=3032207 RepID=UPI0024A4923E|nr:hypothetical protein [Actinomycetospora sp. NBRC 106375]GLZ47502.1 hypothetical protein Acsp06_36870 [Actinomycetospora sp. NBRC 106375]
MEFAVRYVNGPLQGAGSITLPDDAGGEPPLLQRIPLPTGEHGIRRTVSDMAGAGQHAIYERTRYNEPSGEWEFSLVRVE